MENTEGSEGTGTKISDSAYSNSCGNSQSHRSGSSKSRHSGSNSSGSSGYGGKGSSSATNSNGAAESLMSKRTKDKKCKKSKSGSVVKNTTELPSSIRNTENDDRTSNIENNTTCMNRVDNIIDSQIDEINVNCSLKSVDNGSSLILAQQHGTHAADHSLLNLKQERDSSSIDALSPAKIDEHMSVCARSQCTSNSRNIQQLPTHSEGFSCIVSLREGVVLYTNNSITHALGYPQDMWLGRSFINFIHPKDQPLFGSQITSGVASTFVETSAAKNSEVLPRATLYCRIRRYRGIKSSNGGSSGYGVREKDVSYAPFQLNLSFRDAAEFDDPNFYLIIKALPVISPYADGTLKSKKFTTRHTATGLITHIDPVSLIGYLPQDVVGKNIFDFYHPEDMPYLKEVYENILRTEKTFRSKPYRFCTQNGDYLTVESDWSIFINPWSKKMEFVICCHYILQAPNNTDVFQLRTKQVKMFSNDLLKRSKIFQEEIIQLLTGKKSECTKINTIHQTKNMAMFIEKLLNEFQRPKNELEVEVREDTSLSERDSVMLGEISPHHDYFDSKASIETSPSYNQLNYNENLQRFFESKPYTTINSDLIAEDQPIEDNSDTNIFSTRHHQRKSHRRNSCSGDSRSSDISVENVYPSTSKCPPMSQPNVDGYKAAYLTEEVLHKHNIVMEKLLIKKHRDERFLFKAEEHEVGNKKDKKKFNTRHLSAFNQFLKNKNGFLQGIKRSGSASWEQQNDTHKVSKLAMHNQNDYTNVNKVPAAQCYTMMNNNPMPSAPAHNIPTVITNNPQGYMMNSNQIPASPPHMSTMNPNDNRQNPYSNVYPAVYLISPQPDHSQEPNNFSTSNKFPVPYMMYPPPMFTSQPFLYPHMAMAYQPVPLTDPPTQTSVTHDNDSSSIPSIGLPFNNYQQLTSQSVLKRSKFSRNRNVDTKSREDFDNYESSNSSFYSSFLKTETSNSTDIDSGSEPVNTSSVKDNSNDSKYYVPMDNCNSKNGRFEERNCFPNRFGSCSGRSNFRNREEATRSEKFKRNQKPPWLDNVIVTPDLVYRYQIQSHNIGDVLKSDLLFLKTTCQPTLVNQQLSQLYLDMELDGLSQKLTLEEGFTSNSSSEDDTFTASEKKSRYSKLVMIYEEDAPIPPPVLE